MGPREDTGGVNGDGLDDLLIGAKGADPNGHAQAGETYLVYGRADALDIPGDVNGDGQVNHEDVDPFIDVLLNGPYRANADMNGDDLVYEADIEASTVGDHMTRDVHALDAEASLDDAAGLFCTQSVRRFPVTRAGRLVGIVSRHDLIRVVRDVRRQAVPL